MVLFLGIPVDHRPSFSEIRQDIEAGHIEEAAKNAQNLVYQLGGRADLSRMSPGAAALYLLSLVMERS